MVSEMSKNGESCHSSPLQVLRRKLMSPIEGSEELFCFDLDRVQVAIAEPESELYSVAADLVNLAYNARFGGEGREVIDVAKHRVEEGQTLETLVAFQEISARSLKLVVGTLTITYGKHLDCFDLFKPAGGTPWPNQVDDTSSDNAGEIGRFAFHPALDGMEKAYKQQVTRRLYTLATERFKQADVRSLWCVLSRPVRQFLLGAGVVPRKLEGTVLETTPTVVALLRQFPGYWQPDKDLQAQPALYRAPWDLDSLDVKVPSGPDGIERIVSFRS